MIDWQSNEMHVMEFGGDDLPQLAGHIWLKTSGTVKQKWVALSKTAFLSSAQAVNAHLGLTHSDVWLQPLPNHHVGGLSIWARAHLSQSKVVTYPDVTKKKWDPRNFYQTLVDSKASITSLVPTQLFDFVGHQFLSPPNLRYILIGGGYLPDSLAAEAKLRHWPLIPTYGCTECCSQIAAGSLCDSQLQVLPHFEVKVEETLHVKGPALFTCYYDGEISDPKVNGWFNTGDLADLKFPFLQPLGRLDDQIKIGGEKVCLGPLKQLISELSGGASVTLKAIPDERLGCKLILIAERGVETDILCKSFNEKVPGYSRIRSVEFVERIPRNALGKVNASQL